MPVGALELHGDRGARVADRVGEERLERLLHELRVGADSQLASAPAHLARASPRSRPPRRPPACAARASLTSSVPASSRRAAASSVSITACIRSVPRRICSSERRVSADARGLAKGQLGLAADHAERRAQLVRHLRREPLLVAQARLDPAEQPVECRGQRRELVARRAEVEAPVQVVLAPVRRLSGHVGHRLERLAHDPAGHEHPEREDAGVEDQHRDERQVLGPVVRPKRHRHHDGADPRAARVRRLCAQPDPLPQVSLGRPGHAGEAARGALHIRGGRRPQQLAAALVEHPGLLGHAPAVRARRGDRPAARAVERSQLGVGALAERRRGVRVELLGQQEHGPGREQGQAQPQHHGGGERDAAAQGAPVIAARSPRRARSRSARAPRARRACAADAPM